MKWLVCILCVWLMAACVNKQNQRNKWKEEIRAVEAAFAAKADKDGIKDAFLFYAAPNAVLSRNNQLIMGKEEIAAYMEQQAAVNKHAKLSWAPDHIDVSDDGTLAYTYGNYTMTITTEDGTSSQSTGHFHTVWKRQADGEWRYVWD